MKQKAKNKLIKISDEKLSKTFENSNFILRKNESNRKFSQIFLDFLKPLIAEYTGNEGSIKNILTWGVMVWNKAVAETFPDHSHSKNIEAIYPLFYAVNNRKVINEYVLRKKVLFKEEAFFVMSYESHWDNKGNMSMSIAVLQIENNK